MGGLVLRGFVWVGSGGIAGVWVMDVVLEGICLLRVAMISAME
jgi:hypothetical protein